jgi:hypothetical protein
MNTPQLREQTAAKLQAAAPRVGSMSAFIGFDGFVDDIFHVVDKRESAEKYSRLPTISALAERLAAAAGRSTNIEMVSQMVKLGGNGPIMGNALASIGLKVTYLGNLGYPNLHPVFADFAKRAEVHTIAEPGYTDALEFEDGKIMVGKHQALKDVHWDHVKARFGADKFAAKVDAAQLVGFVNWTMLTYMSDIWKAILAEICPGLKGARRTLFIDLADPEKRTREDIQNALSLITSFQKHFEVVLGLNEKESFEIARVLDVKGEGRAPEQLLQMCQAIHQQLKINSVVVHPTAFALAAGPDGSAIVEGPFTPKPKITTGAGDHFNSGFCLGKLLGLTTAESLLTGVTTSGFYVRTAQSPSVTDLAGMMRNWPA